MCVLCAVWRSGEWCESERRRRRKFLSGRCSPSQLSRPTGNTALWVMPRWRDRFSVHTHTCMQRECMCALMSSSDLHGSAGQPTHRGRGVDVRTDTVFGVVAQRLCVSAHTHLTAVVMVIMGIIVIIVIMDVTVIKNAKRERMGKYNLKTWIKKKQIKKAIEVKNACDLLIIIGDRLLLASRCKRLKDNFYLKCFIHLQFFSVSWHEFDKSADLFLIVYVLFSLERESWPKLQYSVFMSSSFSLIACTCVGPQYIHTSVHMCSTTILNH